MTIVVLLSGALTLGGCATPTSHVRTVQAGDAQLSCRQIEQEIGRIDSIVAQAEHSGTTGGLLSSAAQIGIGILQDHLLGGANDFTSHAIGSGAANLLQGAVDAVTDNAQSKARQVREQIKERKKLLTRLYYIKCAQ
jgi:hypothetical protein